MRLITTRIRLRFMRSRNICDYGRVKAWIHIGGGIAGVLNYGDGLGRKELVMIDIYPWASESFGHRKYIKIELMTHLSQPLCVSGLGAAL